MVIGRAPIPQEQSISINSMAHAQTIGLPKQLLYKSKEYLDVLGVRLDTVGSTMTSVLTRLAIANSAVQMDKNAWK